MGKNLALVELRLTIDVLLRHYDVAFALSYGVAFVSGYDPDEICRDMKDQVVYFALLTPRTCRQTPQQSIKWVLEGSD